MCQFFNGKLNSRRLPPSSEGHLAEYQDSRALLMKTKEQSIQESKLARAFYQRLACQTFQLLLGFHYIGGQGLKHRRKGRTWARLCLLSCLYPSVLALDKDLLGVITNADELCENAAEVGDGYGARSHRKVAHQCSGVPSPLQRG